MATLSTLYQFHDFICSAEKQKLIGNRFYKVRVEATVRIREVSASKMSLVQRFSLCVDA